MPKNNEIKSKGDNKIYIKVLIIIFVLQKLFSSQLFELNYLNLIYSYFYSKIK